MQSPTVPCPTKSIRSKRPAPRNDLSQAQAWGLVLAHERRLRATARKMFRRDRRNRDEDIEDLTSMAFIDIVEAIALWDPQREFIPWAVSRIWLTRTNHLRKMGASIEAAEDSVPGGAHLTAAERFDSAPAPADPLALQREWVADMARDPLVAKQLEAGLFWVETPWAVEREIAEAVLANLGEPSSLPLSILAIAYLATVWGDSRLRKQRIRQVRKYRRQLFGALRAHAERVDGESPDTRASARPLDVPESPRAVLRDGPQQQLPLFG